MAIRSGEPLRRAVNEILRATPASDMYTRLELSAPGGMRQYGIDAMLTVPELTESVLRYHPELGELWEGMTQAERAERIWDAHFVKRTPMGEASFSILSVLHTLGLRPDGRRLPVYREYFDRMSASDHMELVFKLTGVTTVCLSFDPLSQAQQAAWESFGALDPRLNASLRLNALIDGWPTARLLLRNWGYEGEEEFTDKTVESVRRFLRYWIAKVDPLYLVYDTGGSASASPSETERRLMEQCVLPVAGEAGIPTAIFLEDQYERQYQIDELVSRYPENRFLCSARCLYQQAQLTRLSRKYGNVHLFGCGGPRLPVSSMEPVLRTRMGLLGMDFTPAASGAVVWDALIPAWVGARSLIAKVLIDKYGELMNCGWQLAAEDIERDAAALLGESFWRFLGRPNPALHVGT